MDASAALVKVLREEGPRVLATLVRHLGDLPVAGDALSEATIAALEAWPASGIPDNPRAWLTVVARRKALDLLRRESARAGKETAAYRWGTERSQPRDPGGLGPLTNCGAAGVLYWFRRSFLHRTQLPISERSHYLDRRRT